jgi:hypothetical protein
MSNDAGGVREIMNGMLRLILVQDVEMVVHTAQAVESFQVKQI